MRNALVPSLAIMALFSAVAVAGDASVVQWLASLGRTASSFPSTWPPGKVTGNDRIVWATARLVE